MSPIKIKVCGITSLQQAEQLADIGVDFVGFIFYPKSPRFVGTKVAANDLKALTTIQKVGVFVNASADEVLNTAHQYGLDMVQLHGDETPSFCKDIKKEVSVVKAFRIEAGENLAEILKPYENVVDYFLFDTKAQEYGGTGKKFDWSVIETTSISLPYFLSGGIGEHDAALIRMFAASHKVFAIDVNSKFETEPGKKNIAAVQNFRNQLLLI